VSRKKENRNKEIKELYEIGLSQSQIARKMGISRQVIHTLLTKGGTVGRIGVSSAYERLLSQGFSRAFFDGLRQKKYYLLINELATQILERITNFRSASEFQEIFPRGSVPDMERMYILERIQELKGEIKC